MQSVGLRWFDSCLVLKVSATPQLFLPGTKPVRGLKGELLYCCALYNFFSFEIRHWRSFTEKVLTLYLNILLPLFWST